jgi:hypothetical protein
MRIAAPSRGRERQNSAHESHLPPRACEAELSESGVGQEVPGHAKAHASASPAWLSPRPSVNTPLVGRCPAELMRSPANLPGYNLLDASLWMCTDGSRLTQSWRVRAIVRRAPCESESGANALYVRLARVFTRSKWSAGNSCTYFRHDGRGGQKQGLTGSASGQQQLGQECQAGFDPGTERRLLQESPSGS